MTYGSALLDRYKFYLTHNSDTRQVFPDNDDVLLSDEKVDGQVFFTRSTSNSIDIVQADFDWLLAIHNGEDRCLPVTIEIKKIVPGESDFLEFTGDFYTEDCAFNIDRCQINVKVKKQDKYEKLYSTWERPINILSGTSKSSIYTTFRTTNDPDTGTPFTEIEELETVETIDIAFGGGLFDDPDFPDPFYGWVMKTDKVIYIENGGGLPHQLRKTVRWVREVTVSDTIASEDLPGNGWGNAGDPPADPGKWTRLMRSLLSSEVIESSPTPGIFTYDRVYSHIATDMERFTNGVSLENALNRLVLGTGFTIKSEWFEINETGDYPTGPTSVYLTGRRPNIFVFQRSDILRPTLSDPATIANISLKDFLKILADKFEVYPVINGTVIQIEHISYREGIQGLDLTSALYRVSLEGNNAFAYEKDTLPSGEKYADNDGVSTIQSYFAPFSLSYIFGLNCRTRTGPVIETTAQVLTDVQSMVATPDNFTAEGLAFISAFPYNGRRIIDSNGYANYLMAPNSLNYLYRHNKYYPYATYGGDAYFVSQSVRRYKAQVELNVKLLDYSLFNPMEEQKTQMGWGSVKTAEFSLKTGNLRLQLLHDD